MLSLLFPKYYVKSIFEIPTEELKNMGIKALVFDIDNTIAPHDLKEPDEASIQFLKGLIEMGFEVIILSNNNKRRVELFNKKLGFVAIYKAGKPLAGKVLNALKDKGVAKENAAIIGDQVFTDVLCGNMAGLVSILTAPICDRDQFITKIKRGLEREVLKIYFKRNNKG